MPPSIINLEQCPAHAINASATGDICQKSARGDVRERPILFSAPMVRAILAGTKTQTRRVVKGSERWPTDAVRAVFLDRAGTALAVRADRGTYGPEIRCPYGKPGDRLWVRETFGNLSGDDRAPEWSYRADTHDADLPPAWTPSIHMPRRASRIDLEITRVRVERLQAMEGQAPYPGESDALAEGVNRIHHGRGEHFFSAFRSEPHPRNWCDPSDAFSELWESINGAGSWAANSWVWVVEFKRLSESNAS